MTYLQEISKRTEEAIVKKDLDELKKIHRELINLADKEPQEDMGIEFFYSMLSSDILDQILSDTE